MAVGTEEFVFMSVDKKEGIGFLAGAVDAQGHRIISLGGTAATIKAAHPNLDIIHPEEFIDNPRLTNELAEYRRGIVDVPHSKIVERECREIVAAYMTQNMSQQPLELQLDMTRNLQCNRSPIGIVVMNLMAPQLLVDREGVPIGLKSDKGGAEMLSGAREGFRLTLTDPRHYEAFATMLETIPYHEIATSGIRRFYARETTNYLLGYEQLIRENA